MENNNKQYRTIGLGGTFDHFHAGHEKFLKFASELSQSLVIGVTNQSIASKKTDPQSIESFAERSKSVENFCNSLGIHFELIELADSIGSTVTDTRIEALAVTTETQGGGEHINHLRKERGFTQLPLHVCELLPASDEQALHSDRIRAGECDRKGLVYSQLFTRTILISENQRLLLAQPQGPIVDQPSFLTNTNSRPRLVILVGDSTIDRFVANHWPFHIGIFDRMIERHLAQGITLDLEPDLTVVNPAGSITPELTQSIQTLLQSSLAKLKYIFVEGEEDLAAIPAVMLSPLGSIIYYGQPQVGLIEVKIGEEIKQVLISTLFH